jgi:hypothetical protein
MSPLNLLRALPIWVCASVGMSYLPAETEIKPDPINRTHLDAAYGKLPLSFEVNDGQTDPQVKFLSRGSGYSLFLTNNEAVLALTKGDKSKAPGAKSTVLSQQPERQSAVLRMKLVDANSAAKITGQDELPGKANYFIGNDLEKWRTNVATYAKVRYEQVYPGIDLVYYGNQRQLEYDFEVAPGADPSRIRFGFTGAKKMRLEKDGGLVVQTAVSTVRWNKPIVYQEVDGQRRAVDGEFVLRRGHKVTFQVAKYDRRKPLVIDPTLVYSTYLGGSGADFGSGIAVDSTGNAYVVGATTSSDFPTTAGVYQSINRSPYDIFITKVNPAGSALVYSTYLGGSGSEPTHDPGNEVAIAVDSAGNAYVTGGTSSSDFPTTAGAFQTSIAGPQDAFITKLNTSGSALVYSTYLGGMDNFDVGNAIAVDPAGSAYVTGYTTSASFPTTAGAFQTSGAGNGEYDGFVTKLDPVGSALVYSTYLAGIYTDIGDGIAVDSAGNAYVVGYTTSPDFPTTAGAFQTSYAGNGDTFVSKLDASGSALVYSTYLGGSGEDANVGGGSRIVVDSTGNAYVTGTTLSTDFPTTAGAFQSTSLGLPDSFVAKVSVTGSGLTYCTYLGGSSSEYGFGIAVDSAASAYVTGFTYSTDFPITPGAFQTALAGGVNGFVAKVDPVGSSLIYASYLGGSGFAGTTAIALDPTGNAYVTGYTYSSDFPTTGGAFQTADRGDPEAIVAKISPAANPTPTPCQFLTSISANFNGTKISKSSYIWFNSVLKPSGLGSTPVTFRFTQQSISSSAFSLSVPDAMVTFDPAATSATTTFSGGMWVTRVPAKGLAGNTFLAGLGYLVPANLPGGIKNVKWSGTISPDSPGVSVQWKWAAAVYKGFSSDNNALGVKPVDDNKASQYKNSDLAGTAENFKSKVSGGVSGGATGGGGSNYTGSYSGTAAVGPCPK